MPTRYNQDFINEVVKAYMAGGKSMSELSAEYNVAKSTITGWIKKYGEECQYKHTTTATNEGSIANEVHRLNQLLKEKDKEIEFLKKQLHSSQRKSISGISFH